MKIHLLHRQQTIEHDNQIPLLSRLEQLGIHHEYQCRSGYCGSCRVKIKKGNLKIFEKAYFFTFDFKFHIDLSVILF